MFNLLTFRLFLSVLIFVILTIIITVCLREYSSPTSLFTTSYPYNASRLYSRGPYSPFVPTPAVRNTNSSRHSPGVILKIPLDGTGIGNQLFLYACSYALAKREHLRLYLLCARDYCGNIGPGVIGVNKNRMFFSNDREFILDKFNIPMVNMMYEDAIDISNVELVSDQAMLERRYLQDPTKYLQRNGSCQSPEFWVDYETDIRSMFQLRTDSIRWEKLVKIRERIMSSESVAVHVRRGDFAITGAPHPPIPFQRRAIRKMAKILGSKFNVRPKYFIFSDDHVYSKKKLLDLESHFDIEFVANAIEGGSTSLEDFFLMTECKHNIIQDSTFSWWAAWLNKNPSKIVIAASFHPDFWRKSSMRNGSDYYRRQFGMMYHPREWIVLNPFTGGI